MKRFLSILLFLCIASTCYGWSIGSSGYDSGGGTDYTQDANCMGAWYLNGATNETDRSSNSADLTWNVDDPDPATSVAPVGYSGKSRNYNDADDPALYMADSGSTDISGADQPISICFWYDPDSPGNNDRFVCKWLDEAGKRQYAVYFYNDDIRFVLSDNGDDYTSQAISNAFPTSGTFHHVAVVYNDVDQRIYIDGVLDTNGTDNPKAYTAGIYNGTHNFVLGAQGDTGGNEMDGVLDEVIIFDRALSAEEVTEIYTYGIDGSNGGND